MLGGAYFDHIGAIRRGQMDFSIVAVPEGKLEPGLHAEHLFYNDLVVVCRKGHPMSRARNLAELVDCQWITGPTSDGPGAAILEAFRQQGLPLPGRILQCDITWTLHNLLVCTDALFALPRLMLEQPGLCTALQALNISAEIPHYSISLVRRADAPLLPMADFLATLVRRHAHYLVNQQAGPGTLPAA
jgi:DNA-binding transcriptional LysR family regulator